MSESTDIEWKSPPPPKPRKVDVVAAQLRSRPGEWAKIESGPITLLPWWSPLYNSGEYEVRFVRHGSAHVFGPRDVYARFVDSKP